MKLANKILIAFLAPVIGGLAGIAVVIHMFAHSNSLTGFSERVRQTANPEEVRAWALDLIAKKATSEPGQIHSESIPSALKTLRVIEMLSASVHSTDHYGQPYVKVFWWSSFGGNKGILIGATNFVVPPRKDCIMWVPGIYFADPKKY